MKKPSLYLAILTASLIYACTPNAEKKATVEKEEISSTTCYDAAFEKDSAMLKLDQITSGKVKGNLLVKYADKPQNNGTIAGEFRGDTLFVDYTFKTGTDTTRTFTNPLALLKKDGQLIMGVGQIETSLGRSYFAKGKPIDFEKGKFIFNTTTCK